MSAYLRKVCLLLSIYIGVAIAVDAQKNLREEVNNTKAVLVSGKIIDSRGNGLSKVTINEKGTKNSSFSNEDGTFKFNVRNNNTSLVFSSVGYKTQEVAVLNNSFLTVTMQQSEGSLDDVVVIGYGSVKKSDLTGAVGTVGAADLNRNKTTGVLQALQGKIAGVDISSQSGDLGAGLNITV
ncbi:MAG: carboxypeptidase-like regulatory domain-containing protein, partial [Chitinophagaceae bacterium]